MHVHPGSRGLARDSATMPGRAARAPACAGRWNCTALWSARNTGSGLPWQCLYEHGSPVDDVLRSARARRRLAPQRCDRARLSMPAWRGARRVAVQGAADGLLGPVAAHAGRRGAPRLACPSLLSLRGREVLACSRSELCQHAFASGPAAYVVWCVCQPLARMPWKPRCASHARRALHEHIQM